MQPTFLPFFGQILRKKTPWIPFRGSSGYPETAETQDIRGWVEVIGGLTDGHPVSLAALRGGYLPALAQGHLRLGLAESVAAGRLEGHFPSLRKGFSHRVTPALLIWDNEPDHQRVRMLSDYFSRVSDHQGVYLSALWVAEHPGTAPQEITDAMREASTVALRVKEGLRYEATVMDNVLAAVARRPLDQHKMALVLRHAAETAYRAGDHDHAIRLWQQIADNHFGTKAWPRALRWLGYMHQSLGQYEPAVGQYERLLVEIPKFEDHHAVRLLVEYQAAQGEAMWQIGQIHLQRGNYAEALETFRTGEEEYPRLGECASTGAAYQYQYRLYQGLCLEHLGRYREATEEYWRSAIDFSPYRGLNPTIWLRAVHIYHAGGQLGELRKKLPQLKNDDVRELFGTAIELQREADRGDWPALIRRLAIDNQSYGLEYVWIRQRYWEATEAARLLARNPDRTVPLLVERLETPDEPFPNDRMWVWYALALADKPETIAALADAGPPAAHTRFEPTFQYVLWLSGEQGQAVLAERFGQDVLEDWRQRTKNENNPSFPPLPEQIQWPD